MEEIILHEHIQNLKFCPEAFELMLTRITKDLVFDVNFTDDVTGINYYDYAQLTLKKLKELDGPSQVKLFRYFMLITTFIFQDWYDNCCEQISQQM